MHDHDGCSDILFDRRIASLGIRRVRTPIKAPRANAIAKRWVRGMGNECLNHGVRFGRQHPERTVHDSWTMTIDDGLTGACLNERLAVHLANQANHLRANLSSVATPSISLACLTARLRFLRPIGGARRDRTADLYNAIVALSQLSYGPTEGGILSAAPSICQSFPRPSWPGNGTRCRETPSLSGDNEIFLDLGVN